MTEPEKLDLRSHDIAEDKKQELLRLFPEIRTEGGKIDFERLKLTLGELVDVGKERYRMNWPGKAECFKTIQAPSLGTLLPCREESVNFDTTENLIIEGDNLEVLTLPPHSASFDRLRTGSFPQGEREPDTAGKTVYSVASGALFICLERELTLDLIRMIADQKPEREVCLDSGFANNDQLKANAVQIFKTKGVTSFRTV